MSFNINKFNANLGGNVLSQAHFLVRILRPNCMMNEAGDGMEDLEFLCNSAQHPRVTIATERIQPFGYGRAYLSPYTSALEDTTTFDFYIRAKDVLPVKLFHYWMQQIVGIPNESFDTPSAGKALKTGQVSYRNDYTTTVEIVSFNQSGQEMIKTTLFDAYPTSVSDIQQSWVSDDILRMQVVFTFAGFRIETGKESNGAFELTTTNQFGTPDYRSPAYSGAVEKAKEKTEKNRSLIDKLTGSSNLAQSFLNKNLPEQLNTLASKTFTDLGGLI